MNKHQTQINRESCLTLVNAIGGSQLGQTLAKQWRGKIFLTLAGLATTTTPGHAMKINATYSSAISLETTHIIAEIGKHWEQELKDPITLNLNFSFSNNLPTGVLGGSKPGMIRVNYKDYLTALGQDYSSQDDISAVKSKLTDLDDQALFNKLLADKIERKKFKVKDTKTLDVLIDETFTPNNSSGNGNGVLDDNDNNNNKKIWLTRGNAKALGFIKGDDKKLDASIVLNNAINWDMNPNDGISSNAYDFHTVVLHEIGHALGSVSGADAIEFLSISSTGTITDDDLSYITPMNTYTYSDKSAGMGVIDLRLGQGIKKYISLNGGATKLKDEQGNTAFLSTGGLSIGGDGYQTSHWKKASTPLGIMTPTLEMGQSVTISELDRTLFDVMGWDLINRTRELMNEVGLDWQGFQEALDLHGDQIASTYNSQWQLYNPGDTIEAELKAELLDLYKDVEPDIHKELLKLKKDLAKEDDPQKRAAKRTDTMAKIWDDIEDQDKRLKHFADHLKDVNVKVRDWLDEDIDKLSDLLQDANRVQIHKLQEIIADASPEQQHIWKEKLRQALALFLDDPDKALEQITKTNDFHSPIGWGSGTWGGSSGWWGGWWSSSTSDEEDLGLYYSTASPVNAANSVQSPQTVPEPSSVISLMVLEGLGLLGFLAKRGSFK